MRWLSWLLKPWLKIDPEGPRNLILKSCEIAYYGAVSESVREITEARPQAVSESQLINHAKSCADGQGRDHSDLERLKMLTARDLQRPGLSSISFNLGDGECVAVQGPSGSSKTLLLRAIADLDPNQGEILLEVNRAASFQPQPGDGR